MDGEVDPKVLEERARVTHGGSSDKIYRMVANELADRVGRAGTFYDVGCGTGALHGYVGDRVDQYVGVDLIRYDTFPVGQAFHAVPLDTLPWPIASGSADVTAAVETIEHLENPRAFVRELARITKPGGLVIVTTPNQLSLLSKLTFLLKNEFNAFQERPGLYPSHITALLEIDLIRIATECGLTDVRVRYPGRGRLPGTSRCWPTFLGGRAFSDNVLVSGRTKHA